MLHVVIFLVSLGARVIRAIGHRRADLVIENLALRQQLAVVKKERPRPPFENTETGSSCSVLFASVTDIW